MREQAHLDQARKVADAILYEGYLLYPYHQAAQKNQARFQFGVLMPPAYAALDPSEPSASQSECLLECGDDARVHLIVRFLQLQQRRVLAVRPGTGDWQEVASLEAGGTRYTRWDEATAREHVLQAQVSELTCGELGLSVYVPPGEDAVDITDSAGKLAGRLVRSWTGLDGVVRLRAERVLGPYRALRLTARVENHTVPAVAPQDRRDGLAHAFIAAHTLIWVPGGSFLSMTDPPQWAAAEAASCENIGTWPVLAGPAGRTDLVLSSPVILHDHAEIAPESAGDLFDATEIDEILTLRTLALTDAEKRAARATDPKAAELVDRLDRMPPEIFGRLHGAIRYLRSAPAGGRPGAPWWDPGSDASVSPQTDQVIVDGVQVRRGSRVRMRPGARRADAQDLFLIGREATVQAVLHDVDGKVHLAVSPLDDPLVDLHGRFLYFGTDEIEPVGELAREASDPAGDPA